MTEKLDWLRLWTDFRHDAKVQLLSFDDQRHYICLLTMKRDGTLDAAYSTGELRERIVARELGLSEDKAGEVKRRISEVDLIDADWQPLGWDRRQYESDSAAKRMREYRARRSKGATERNGDVTVTPSESDTDTDTESDTEGEVETLTLAPSPTGSGPAKGKRKTATRIPDDMDLTADRLRMAAAEGIDPTAVQREFLRFADYWRAASGANARKHDWDATWRNWCRRAADDLQKNGPRKTGAIRKTRADEIRDHLIERERNATR